MKIQVTRQATFTGHRDCVYTVAPGPTPTSFFSAGGDGLVVLWDLEKPDQGQLIAQLPTSVYALHYRPDLDLLLIGQNFEGIHAIRVKERQEVKSVKITGAALFDLQTAGDAVFAATGDGYLLRLDLRTLTVKKALQVNEKSARAIALHPTRSELAVGYSDHTIRILAPDSLEVLHTLDAHQNSVFTVQYTPDGRSLLSGSRDAHLKRWRVDRQYAFDQQVVAHMYAINHLTFSADGRYFASASMDKSIKVWDAETLRLLKVIDRARHAGHGTSVNKLLWLPGDLPLVSASDDRTLSVWQLDFFN
ncbi:WD domain-containing protein, G-beta repeat-containing protein [Catalinimonas alkaloidigena]|uniref:WD domain-containing protein, G-beta repeat-containing protein n=1 Tax=Catalinimonas alkaloidigena TaxID=1075417 RepID=A0A1G8XM98_9BACT|nr:cytochrome D1 domain-containing protein [Catalinimonas alkaloidigena]SDJ91284.1 WD domain-containing protein, G-beta repeat-containing protein [Catalinimonas alkaloidigena]